MKRIILIRYGEIMLKGLNRNMFISKLIFNIKNAVKPCGDFSIVNDQGRLFISPDDENFDFDSCIEKVIKVFGIVSISPVLVVDADMENIKKEAVKNVSRLIEEYGHKTFKVETKRADKAFPLKSPKISCDIGEIILNNFSKLKVDVHNPDFTLHIEIRKMAYIFSEIIKAHGGMPVGTNGKAVLLLSGGIDSPVAGWMTAKRGVRIDAVHFYSYPYTSERSKEKVIDLAKKISLYTGKINLHIVPFTKAQLEINEKCPEREITVIMRRVMMKTAQQIAKMNDAKALITGESIGQVASQTMDALYVTDNSVEIPVFRPLIGMDKIEVIKRAKEIGTYETSILPYEDCCTVFVAKHPNTRPKLERILEYEKNLDIDKLIKESIDETEIIKIG